MASKKLSTDTSLANSYKLSRGVASVARPSAPTIGTATDGGSGLMSVTFTASTLGPTASSFTLTSSSGVTGTGASSPLTLQETAVGTYTYSVSGVNANGTGPSSAASNSVVVASVVSPSYDSIATASGTGSSGVITFSSIPSTYTHLQIRCSAQTTGTAYGKLSFNSDTTNANYKSHELVGNGTAASTTAYAQSYGGVIINGYGGWGNTSGSASSATIIDILDYTNTNKYKTTRTLAGLDNNGGDRTVEFQSGLWLSTAAISSITLTLSANSFASLSRFALYGIKGA